MINYDKWQLDFYNCKGDKILCTGRQVGKSLICAKDAGDWACSHSNKLILMTAPQEFQAEELFIKTLAYIQDNYPNLIKTKKDKPTKTEIKLKNGTIIRCKTPGMTGLGLRSMTIHRLYVDECSQMPEMVWEVLDPELVTTGGDIIYLSTPFGMSGRFWDCWNNKDNAYDSFTRFSVSTEDVINQRPISSSWTIQQREAGIKKLEEAKKRLSKLKYAQEYLGMFVENLMQFFPDRLVQKLMTLKRSDRIIPSEHYYLGVDVGGRGGDETTLELFDVRDKTNIIHTESIVKHIDMTTDTEREIIHLNNLYNCKRIYIDDGGMGVGVFDHLLEVEETKRKVVAINNSSRSLDRDDERKKKLLKEDLYENCKCLMERGEVHFLDDPAIFQSFKSVQIEIDEDTRQRKITGTYTHIVEGIIRALWGVKDKSLNIFVR